MRAVLARTDAPSVRTRDAGEQPRGQRRTADPGRRRRRAIGALHGVAGDVVGQRVCRGDGHADEDPAPEPEPEVERDERPRPPRRPRRDAGAAMPAERAKNPGSSVWPTATTGTPRVSRYSSVAGTSRIALGPAHTTAIGVRPSSSRSDEMSKVGRPRRRRAGHAERAAMDAADAARREHRIPAACAAIIVADTVVAAQPPAASATARLGRAALRTDPAGAVASASERRLSSPTSSRPSWMATVAGTAPGSPDGRLGGARDLEVLRVRQAVADQRRLERDDGPPAASASATSGLMSRQVGAMVALA